MTSTMLFLFVVFAAMVGDQQSAVSAEQEPLHNRPQE